MWYLDFAVARDSSDPSPSLVELDAVNKLGKASKSFSRDPGTSYEPTRHHILTSDGSKRTRTLKQTCPELQLRDCLGERSEMRFERRIVKAGE